VPKTAPSPAVHSDSRIDSLKDCRNCGWLNVVEMLANVVPPAAPVKAPVMTSYSGSPRKMRT
jgi:hypothetical protein